MDFKKPSLFGHHKLLCARIRDVVDDKGRRRSLRKKGRRVPEKHYFVEYSREGSKVEGANPSETMSGM